MKMKNIREVFSKDLKLMSKITGNNNIHRGSTEIKIISHQTMIPNKKLRDGEYQKSIKEALMEKMTMIGLKERS